MLKKGEQVPGLILKDQNGNDVPLKSYIGEKSLVIYFYPKDDTPGCTAEACTFRDRYEDFAALGAEVIGISGDSIGSHASVATKRKLPFLLLSDTEGKAAKAFGVPRHLFGLLPGRATFVIDMDGTVVHTFNSALNAKQHIFDSLKFLKGNS